MPSMPLLCARQWPLELRKWLGLKEERTSNPGRGSVVTLGCSTRGSSGPSQPIDPVKSGVPLAPQRRSRL